MDKILATNFLLLLKLVLEKDQLKLANVILDQKRVFAVVSKRFMLTGLCVADRQSVGYSA